MPKLFSMAKQHGLGRKIKRSQTTGTTACFFAEGSCQNLGLMSSHAADALQARRCPCPAVDPAIPGNMLVAGRALKDAATPDLRLANRAVSSRSAGHAAAGSSTDMSRAGRPAGQSLATGRLQLRSPKSGNVVTRRRRTSATGTPDRLDRVVQRLQEARAVLLGERPAAPSDLAALTQLR
jgi:hypothetical protein